MCIIATTMPAASINPVSRVLQSAAWAERVDAVLLKKRDAWEKSLIARSHGHALRRLFEDIGADAVLCTEGRPALCILGVGHRSAVQIEQIRRKLWNLGATTLLLVETTVDVRLFSTLAKPARMDAEGRSAQLARETIENLESVALALRLRQLIRRVETGAIYRDDSSLFAADRTVDRDLLENLKQSRNLICPNPSKGGYQRAHALIGRFLFSCYLLDRGIIGPPYLGKKDLPPAHDMLGLLSAELLRVPVLERLFNALHRDFNGSLFGEPFPPGGISEDEVAILLRLLSGENLRSGQLALGFKLYDFSYVPVEFISSIYEEFLGAEAAAEAGPKSPNQPRNDAQRVSGAYYTPPRLAELAVDVATEGWSTLLDKRCLDPACGSGIFLVILFIRMAEEWRRRNPVADTEERYQGLLSLLEKNLHGIDLQFTACLVACFSLYLAFLDQMDPKEVNKLREALERDTRTKILPRILWERGKEKPRVRERHFATVRELDFFQLDPAAEFHLVIGNPPWVSRKPALEAETWLYSGKNPHTERLGWKLENSKLSSHAKQTLFPDKEVACAFMWKASLHLATDGRVCQVLPSRVFLSNHKERFQAAWLGQHRIESIWLLADYRFILFSTADCPCVIARYRPRVEGEALGEFEFVTPKVERLDPRQALLPVLPEDQKSISQADLLSSAEGGGAAAAWKRNHWGTPRDQRLLARLLRWPRLSRIAVSPPDGDEVQPEPEPGQPAAPRVWFTGQGFQPATASTETPHAIFWHKDDRFLSAQEAMNDLVLLREQTTPIGDRYREVGLHRKRNPLLYRHPLLLVNKACTKFLFADFDVLFQDDLQSICAPPEDEAELLFLTAYFSSPLAQYILFHTTANIGIERDIARLTEMLELPFPLPEDLPDPDRARRIIQDCAISLQKLRSDLGEPRNLLRHDSLVADAKIELYRLVSDYFSLCEWERELIADTVDIFRPSSTPGSLDSNKILTAQPSTEQDRSGYVETLARTFRAWSRTNQHLWVEGYLAPSSGLALITFGIGSQRRDYTEFSAEGRVEELITTIRQASAEEIGVVFRRLRGFAYYDSDQVHLLKPLSRRHWTRTAALNDADEILAQMMEEGGWAA